VNILKQFLKTIVYGKNKEADGYRAIRPTALVCFDVGAAHGLQPQWQKLMHSANFCMFEPNDEAIKNLKSMYSLCSNFTFVNCALSDHAGEETLTVTNAPTGSTILQINQDSEGFQSSDKNYFLPWKEIRISVDTLADISKKLSLPAPDLIKLDTQGSELKILKGLDEQRLRDLTCVEIEISLIDLYRGQDNVEDVISFLRQYDLVPYDIRVSRAISASSLLSQPLQRLVGSKSKDPRYNSCRSAEIDIVFFKKPQTLISGRKKDEILKLICSFCTYNFFFQAINTLERSVSENILNASEAASIRSGVNILFHANARKRRFEGIRLFIKNPLSFFRKFYWARFLWVTPPST